MCSLEILVFLFTHVTFDLMYYFYFIFFYFLRVISGVPDFPIILSLFFLVVGLDWWTCICGSPENSALNEHLSRPEERSSSDPLLQQWTPRLVWVSFSLHHTPRMSIDEEQCYFLPAWTTTLKILMIVLCKYYMCLKADWLPIQSLECSKRIPNRSKCFAR